MNARRHTWVPDGAGAWLSVAPVARPAPLEIVPALPSVASAADVGHHVAHVPEHVCAGATFWAIDTRDGYISRGWVELAVAAVRAGLSDEEAAHKISAPRWFVKLVRVSNPTFPELARLRATRDALQDELRRAREGVV